MSILGHTCEVPVFLTTRQICQILSFNARYSGLANLCAGGRMHPLISFSIPHSAPVHNYVRNPDLAHVYGLSIFSRASRKQAAYSREISIKNRTKMRFYSHSLRNMILQLDIADMQVSADGIGNRLLFSANTYFN